MKRFFFLALALPAGFSAVQQASGDGIKAVASGDSLKVVASPIYQVGELSWDRTLNWVNFIAQDTSSSPASEIDSFKVDIVEDMEPGHRKVTKYITSWTFHNFSEDNKHGSPLQLTVTFYDKDGHRIDSFEQDSPRDFCTYSPAYQEIIPAPIIAKHNRLDDISTAVLGITYNATYEGSC